MCKLNRRKNQWLFCGLLVASLVFSPVFGMADDQPAAEPPSTVPASDSASPELPSVAPAPESVAKTMQALNKQVIDTIQYLAEMKKEVIELERMNKTATPEVTAFLKGYYDHTSSLTHRLEVLSNAIDAAQEELPSTAETLIIKVEHGNVQKIASLLGVFQISGCQVVPDEQMQVLAVSGSSDAVTQIEDAVKLLDKPTPSEPTKKNLELLVYLLEGCTQSIPDEIMPAELEDVVAQLSQTFRFPSFRLRDTLLLRCRDGEGTEISNAFPDDGGSGTQKLRIERVAVSSENLPMTVHLDEFIYGANLVLPSSAQLSSTGQSPRVQRVDVGFKANLDVQEGQKVVVGKANLGSVEKTVFVVVTVKIVSEG